MPQSRPMPSIAARCHEPGINDEGRTWRLMYRIDTDAIPILAVFAKKTEKTPDEIIRTSRKRLKDYDDADRKAKAPRSKRLEGRKR
jgi:phage-related protein